MVAVRVTLLCLALLLVGCSQPPEALLVPTPAPTATPILLRVSGANTMVPLLQELGRSYSRSHPGLIVEVSGGGSAWGLTAVEGGQAEIGMVSRPLSEGEQAGVRAHAIARDGLALIVHPSNPINQLDQAELPALFSGERFLWDDFGWLAGPIQIVSREPGSGDRALMAQWLLPDGRELSPNAALLPSPEAVVALVAREPAALGYVSLAHIGAGVKVLRVDERAPSLESVASGEYPFTRELLLVTSEPPSPAVQAFIDWILSESGQHIVTRNYLPIQPR